jgi:hypothetical protein
MSKHFFVGNNYDDFPTFIENIMYNKNNHHLVFDDNNILKRINLLYGVNDEIATIVVGKQYDFKNMVPEPYINYLFNQDIDVYHLLLDEKDYALLSAIGETIDNIYSFDAEKENFNEVLEDIKYTYFIDPKHIFTQEVKEICIKIFEDYAKKYYEIINVNEPKIYNKYDEDYHYEQIYDKIYDLQKYFKEKIIKEMVDKYFEIYKIQQ